MEAIDNEELSKRETCGLLSTEGKEHLYKDKKLFEKALYQPDEVWLEDSELREEYYTHILRFEQDGTNWHFILVCTYYEGEPSFVFFKTITKSAELVDLYRKDIRKDDELNSRPASMGTQTTVTATSSNEQGSEDPGGDEGISEVSLPSEVLEDLELKKSQVLAELLDRRKESDIGFEEFMLYDEYIRLSIDDPDETFETEDKAGDLIVTNIKSFQRDSILFFYIVICAKVEIPGNDEQMALIPILTFPSIDNELYKFYAVGERTHGKLKS